ncbi:nucleotidyltransferase domain-containing protein [Gracilibacillus thailandensis]|uniref:Nucleotidyltransferase domain-containing protein n=1 Tax=Gracilibacillus thailandensis TaxID=563735 RepID=A0A6N7QZX4_9BACI|nr:nucleotidyltransferase domain-containing protein [Gracilibacillus thailandensis]MRI66762.1 nucleotidyltransferase domain-containing protein [Gracilibacillus thailandensis]
MEGYNRLSPREAAGKFIQNRFRNCQGALLAGSVIRGEATKTSDLDIVIFDRNIQSAYRESIIDLGWNIEIFVHNLTSYKDFFVSDCESARPALPRMVVEGEVIIDKGIIAAIKNEAKELLDKGPKKWSEETINTKRYFITDALDDLIGSLDRAESLFIVNKLAEQVSEFVLRTNNKWIGDSKWVIRSLKNYDEEFAERFVDAFDTFYKINHIDKIIMLVDEVLSPHGGRLFDGFSLGK